MNVHVSRIARRQVHLGGFAASLEAYKNEDSADGDKDEDEDEDTSSSSDKEMTNS